jgi:AcrR family transcriptional regulator
MQLKGKAMDEPREKIIDCAREVLKESGYQAFSMEKVARASSLELQELQLYFADRSRLLTVLATSFLESHCGYVESCSLEKKGAVQQALNQWLFNLLKHRESEACDLLFKEFWAIALHDREMRLVLDQYYRQLEQLFFNKLQVIASESCSRQQIEAACCFLLPFIEGYSVTRSTLPTSLLLLSEQLSSVLQTFLYQR